jgi:hypothetical protein
MDRWRRHTDQAPPKGKIVKTYTTTIDWAAGLDAHNVVRLLRDGVEIVSIWGR